mmetsp:Transcript_48435/g.115151  ORF Transcript_48435/g.115151 Transcript_48435/m.115151 type:complete len:661 (-) Transcript_48435:62-2044(-)
MKMMVALRVVVSISAFAGVKSDASFALMDSIQAACQKTSITQPMRASNLASTTQTVTRAHPMRVEAVPSWVPAVHSIGAEDISQRSMQKINKVRSQIGSTRYCADIAALVSDLREISSAHIASVEAMSLVDSSEVAEAGVISSEIARTFNELVIRWAELPWCPRAVKAITQSMQVVSEEWIQMYSGYGILSMDAARISSSTWAQAFTNVTNAWQEATARAKDCKDTTVMMGLLKDMVTSVSSSTQAWVGFFDKVHGQDEDEVEVMGEWLRPMQAALSSTKENSMAWAHSCGAFEGTATQAKAAAEAVADFLQHFSTKALLTSQQWAQAFNSCAPQCWAAAEQASIMASSVIHMSDIAQVSTAWSLAFSGTDSAAATSAKWSQTYASLIRDVQAQSLTWSAALRTASGSEPGVTVTSASNAWASSLQLLSVSFAVAAEGWLQTSQEHGSAKWAESAGALVRAAGEAAQGWAEVLPPINLDQGATTRALHSSNVWARALDGMVANTINIAQVVRQGLSMEVSSQWAEACGSMQEGVRIGAFAWMSLLERHNDTDLLAGGDSTEGALESLITALVDSSAGTVDIGMKLVADETYDVWSLAIDQALAIGEDAPLDAASHAFAGSLEEAMRHFAHLPGNPSSIQLRDHICSQAPSLVICSKQSEM